MSDPVSGATAPVLPPRYYLKNFLRLLRAVHVRYDDLLTQTEKDFLKSFQSLPEPAQCLYVRLVSRVGPWFRAGRLSYAEIGPIEPVLNDLILAGMVEEVCELDLENLARLFTRKELAALYEGEAGKCRGLSKADLLEWIAARDETDAERWQRVASGTGERIIAPLQVTAVALLQLLFFGNRHQSLVDFVLSDLGIARYFPYPLSRETRLFPNRAAVEAYQAINELSDLHWQWQEAPDSQTLAALADASLALVVTSPVALRAWWRLCNRLARDCERAALSEQALKLYAVSKRHPARERRARVLETLGEDVTALAVVEDILEAPWCEAESAAAERMARRLRRRVHGKTGRRPRDQFPTEDLQVARVTGSVERDSALAIAERGWSTVRYVENGLFNSLFGLAFWEQIFAPITGAFHHPYQSAPADMYSREFYQRRAGELERRLEYLLSCDLARELACAFDTYKGYQCRWTDWRFLDRELVVRTASCMLPEQLIGIWRRQLFDPADNRRGFPDLIALGEDPGDFHLYEIKGPGDSLQEHQRRWLNHFSTLGVPASVQRVTWL